MTTLHRDEPPAAPAGPAPRERMLAGLALTERRLHVAGVSTAVLEAGDGPPLILLHGGIECRGAYWAPVIARLAASHRLVVPDVPGLGESEPLRPPGRSDLRRLARLAGAFDVRAAADVDRTLAAWHPGHSLRGAACDLLARLVVYAAPGVGHYRIPLAFRVVAIRYGLRPTERNNERFERWALFELDRTRARDPDWFAAFDS